MREVTTIKCNKNAFNTIKCFFISFLLLTVLSACQDTNNNQTYFEKADIALYHNGRIYYTLHDTIISFEPDNIADVKVEYQSNINNSELCAIMTKDKDSLYVNGYDSGVEMLDLETKEIKELPDSDERILLCRKGDELYLLIDNQNSANYNIVSRDGEREIMLLQDITCFYTNNETLFYVKENEQDKLYAYNFQTEKTSIVFDGKLISSFYATNNTILFNESFTGSFCLYNLQNQQFIELTEFQSYHYWYRDGKAYFELNQDSETPVYVIEIDTGTIEKIESDAQSKGVRIGDWRYYDETIYDSESLTAEISLYRANPMNTKTEKIYSYKYQYSNPSY